MLWSFTRRSHRYDVGAGPPPTAPLHASDKAMRNQSLERMERGLVPVGDSVHGGLQRSDVGDHGVEAAYHDALGERRRIDSLIRSAADIGTATMKLGRPPIRRNSQLQSRCGAPFARGDLHSAAQ